MRFISTERYDKAVKLYQSGATQAAAGRAVGIDQASVSAELKRRGIPSDTHRKPRLLTDEQREEVARLYIAGVPNKEIIARMGLRQDRCGSIIYSTLRALGVPRRAPLGSRVGKKCEPGDTSVNREGYVVEKLAPDWPFMGKMSGFGDGTWMMQHRKVMAEALGRPLARGEQVHHKNGNRQDNRPGNLQLRIGGHGSGGAYCCADCGSARLNPVALG